MCGPSLSGCLRHGPFTFLSDFALHGRPKPKPASTAELPPVNLSAMVRVRFAPSPTGGLHVGALRDALFKFLFARHHGGANILRIEDTDRSRYSPDAEAEFLESLAWIGIDYEEGPHVGGPNAPYRQSERKEAGLYAEPLAKLLAAGHAYKAFDTSEELDEMRKVQEINKQPIGYFGGIWRDADATAVAQAEAEGKPFVVRQRIPRGKTIAIEDAVRGRVEWDSDTVDDPVLMKADGMPTYHFAAMVDDRLMGITHIIRGEEWLSSAPKHAELFDQFGWERPIFVHCPVIKGKDGKKLSKRDGAGRVLDYRAAGYLPGTLANFIALIGWSPGDDREILSMKELVAAFDLEGLQPSPGLFDLDKLKWMNGNAIRAMELKSLMATIHDYTARAETVEYWRTREAEDACQDPAEVGKTLLALKKGIESNPDYALQAIAMEQQRIQTLADFGPACSFFFQDKVEFDPKAVEKWFAPPHVEGLFERLVVWLPTVGESVTSERCEAWVRDYAASTGLEKLGPAVHPIRVALTGRTFGPGLFELMSLLGPARMIDRFQRAKGLVP